MINRKFTALLAAFLLSLATAVSANQPAAPAAPADSAVFNPFDMNNWMGAFAGQGTPAISGELQFNAAHPSSWMAFVDPATHVQMHRMVANPVFYTQFMQPQFYMEFAKPENMAAWMNPEYFQVMMSPQAMNYWMNPAAYMHMFDPAMYQETMNPANYMVYMDPNTYMAMLGTQTCDPENPAQGWFGSTC